jgi:predicted transcriptional regulator
MTTASSTDRWTRILTKQLLKTELKAGRTPKDVAASVGCSENTVRDHLARHGLLDVDGAPKSLVRDYTKYGSITALADLHGVSFSTARRWLLAAGIEINKAHRPTHTGLDVSRAAARYESGESLATIAGEADIGINTLKRRLESHGTVMRPRGRPAAAG